MFLDGQAAEMWAWEFLRRHPIYQKNWKRLEVWKQTTGEGWKQYQCAKVYRPRMKSGESEKEWKRRVSYETGIPPTSCSLDVHFGSKWALCEMYDPSLPFSQGVRFLKPLDDFPRMLIQPDDFMELVEDEELIDGSGFQRVLNNRAVVAFDLTLPLEKQMKIVQKMLLGWQEEMNAAGRLEKEKRTTPKIQKWKRHLRALDALRTSPTPTYAGIAKVLEGHDESRDCLHKQGDKIITAARGVMRNYPTILKYKGTPV